MIRHRRGSDFLLIAQDDHAQLAETMAKQIGGSFAGLNEARVFSAIAMHDSGWPLHDDCPTLNPKGEPLDVLEVPMPIATRVWAESARRAAEADPYTGLLVSLHVMRLSGLAAHPGSAPHERAESREDFFLLNQFQQRQIELQEELRQRLNLRIDLPRRLGLVDPGIDEREDRLRYHYDLLRLMDGISLDLCSDQPLFPVHERIAPALGSPPITLRVQHLSDTHQSLNPWPFAERRLALEAPCRRVAAGSFTDEPSFQHAYAAAVPEPLALSLSAPHR